MKFLKSKATAWIVTGLVIAGCLGYGVTQRSTGAGSSAAAQQSTPAAAETWVRDEANLLSQSTESKLNSYNARWDNDYRSVVAVLTVDSVGSETMEDYAYDYGETWGLGENDMLLLLSRQDGDFYFVISYSEIVPDEQVADALYDDFYEEFYSGDYDEAVLDLFDEMDEVYEDYAPRSVSYGNAGGYGDSVYYSEAEDTGVTLVGLVFFILLVILILNAIDKSRYRRWYRRYGVMPVPPVRFVPMVFWRRPGGAWYRRMDRRYQPHVTGPQPGFRSGTMPPPGTRPGNSRPSGFGGSRSSGFSGSSRPGSFGSSGGSRPSGFGGSSRSGGFGGSSFSGGSRGGSFGGSSRGGGFGGGGGSRGGGFGGRR